MSAGDAGLTSDQGVVYHLKHGLSKQVFSSSGLSLAPHSSSSKVLNFPPEMPAHSTILCFTPRPHVVLHCGRHHSRLNEPFDLLRNSATAVNNWNLVPVHG